MNDSPAFWISALRESLFELNIRSRKSESIELNAFAMSKISKNDLVEYIKRVA